MFYKSAYHHAPHIQQLIDTVPISTSHGLLKLLAAVYAQIASYF